MLLTIEKVTKHFSAQKITAIHAISFQLQIGKIYALVGESGSGKTTLARLIAGLERPNQGNIYLDNQLLASQHIYVSAQRRPIGLVFQDYALFPHLTVAENIGFGIEKLKDKKAIIQRMLQLIDLDIYSDRYPHELSGGQQQRVALARALAPKPRLLILDEPFSNLDRQLRVQLREEVFRILRATQIASIFITHDTQDALAVSDEILILKSGQLVQQATPECTYRQPISPYVAQLFDPIVALSNLLLSAFGYSPQPTKKYYLRQHHFTIDESSTYEATAQVIQTTFSGSHYSIVVKSKDQEWTILSTQPPASSTVKVGFSDSNLLCFDE